MNNKINNNIIEGAKTAFIDKEIQSDLKFKPSLITNNDDENNNLLSILINELETCKSFKFSSAFITLNGIQPLKEIFNYLQENNIPGKILTTDYLYFTEPEAIEFLNNYENIEIKIFKQENQGFHTKGYIFEKENGYTGIIGSSNLTSKALNENEEWNLGFTSEYDGELLYQLNKEFDKLWGKSASFDEYFIEYQTIYKSARSFKEIKEITNNAKKEFTKKPSKISPNKMQLKFLEKMDNLIERGETKAMLVSATGTGKTYASAFEVRKRNPKKFLFIVHRFQIAEQAKETYKKVINDSSKKFGLLGNGQHDLDADFLFSTFQSLYSQKRYEDFEPTEFDYIVVDEVHKAGADTYNEVINYFEPKFLLGMTATPWRNDDKDIFELFDENLVYEVTLQDALNEKLVCPFHYFGISDLEVNGETIGDDLNNFNFLTSDERVNHILKKSEEYGFSGENIKALVFCSSLAESEELAKKFTEKGHNSKSLSGENSIDERNKTIDKLVKDNTNKRLEYIFIYDIFNEGIDIKEINQVILARPTKSAIIFTQQLGRGLRKHDDKDFVVILDFIGNYRNNYLIPIALSGLNNYTRDNLREYVMPRTKIISGSSSISFDEISRKRIFKSIDTSNFSKKYDLKEKYHILKRKLGKIPMLCDILNNEDFNPQLIFEHKDFPNYYSFLEYCHKNDDEFNDFLEESYLNSLSFISKQLSNGKRPHELIILNLLKYNKYFKIKQVEEHLEKEYGLKNQLENIKGAINVLNFNFYLSNQNNYHSDIQKYITDDPENTFFKMNDIDLDNFNNYLDYKFEISDNFSEMLKNPTYYKYFEDLINYSLQIYDINYKGSDIFKINEIYTRKDFCRLMNWNYNYASTINGYTEKNNSIPIFITYEKDEDISDNLKYNDKFISNSIISWESRDIKNDKAEKEIINKIINYDKNNIKLYLFIKKSDYDKDKYYYFGEVEPKNPIAPKEGSKKIYTFELKLKNPVNKELYDYFTTPLYHDIDN